MKLLMIVDELFADVVICHPDDSRWNSYMFVSNDGETRKDGVEVDIEFAKGHPNVRSHPYIDNNVGHMTTDLKNSIATVFMNRTAIRLVDFRNEISWNNQTKFPFRNIPWDDLHVLNHNENLSVEDLYSITLDDRGLTLYAENEVDLMKIQMSA